MEIKTWGSVFELCALEEPFSRFRGAACSERIMHWSAAIWAFVQHMSFAKGAPPPLNNALEVPEWFIAFRAPAR